MPAINRPLLKELRRKRVRVESVDSDTLLFRRVPTAARFFNKEHTNLLVKQMGQGMPTLLFVDEDLAYWGENRALTKAFSSGQKQKGWRSLYLGARAGRNLNDTVEMGLRALGFRGDPECPVSATRDASAAEANSGDGDPGVLDTFGVDLAAQIADLQTVGRRVELETIVCSVLRWSESRLPLIVGESGTGKTHVLLAAAKILTERRPDLHVVRVDAAELLSGMLFDADREQIVSRLLEEATRKDGCVLALERFESLVRELPHGIFLLSSALDRGLRAMGTVFPSTLERIVRPPLARRLQPVLLSEATASETIKILQRLQDRLHRHHHVKVPDDIMPMCVRTAAGLPGCFPAKAVTLIDSAAAHASFVGAEFVSPDDICAAARRLKPARAVE